MDNDGREALQAQAHADAKAKMQDPMAQRLLKALIGVMECLKESDIIVERNDLGVFVGETPLGVLEAEMCLNTFKSALAEANLAIIAAGEIPPIYREDPH